MNNPLDRLGLKYKIFISNAILIIVAGLILFFITLPSIDVILAIRNDIYTERKDLEEKYNRSLSLKKLTGNLKSIEPKIEKLDQVFISLNRELEFITALEDVAEKNNITQHLSLGKAQSVGGDKNYKKVPLNLQIAGNFNSVLSYISNLESIGYYINIKTIDIVSGGGIQSNTTDDVSSLSVSIAADTYWK